ncbi:hypothetical protein H5410_031649, partial [Solanum commersonii]
MEIKTVLSSELHIQVQDNLLYFYHKEDCVTTAYENFEQRNHPSIEILLNECFFDIFKHLPSGQERSVCACVYQRWLMLLSNIHNDEIAESNGIEGKGYLVKSLFGRKPQMSDLLLLSYIFGGNNPCRGVFDAGLEAITRGCPTLRDFSFRNVSLVRDESLSEIAHGCHLLEKLDLFQCPTITNKSLFNIAMKCSNMTSRVPSIRSLHMLLALLG